jgi:SNF2 family DNA or RNA helicase
MKKPYRHQVVTSKFLLENPKAFCWNAPGTGKTLSCLLAYRVLRNHDFKKLLIISTLSTTMSVWGREFFCEFLETLPYGLLLGSRNKRLETLRKNRDVYVINHDGIKILENELIEWAPEVIIVDEHTAFKNARSERFKSLYRICKEVHFIWALSGTPCPQAPTDLYAMGKIICPELVGKSFICFRDRVMQQVNMFKWLLKANWERQIADWPVIRFSREECLDLPSVTHITLDVEMSPLQKSSFEILRKEAVLMLEDKEILALHEGVMRMKLLQCCSGYVYSSPDPMTGTKSIVDLQPGARLNAVIDLIEECQKGVIIFASFTSSIAALYDALKLLWKCAIVDGSVSMTNRTNIFAEFQNGNIQVIIAHPKTMGHGVTLTYADTIIWYLVTSDAELYEQANGRINRIGQTCKMRVIHLISTKLEEKVLERLEQKQSMQGLLLETLEQKV